MTGPPVGTPEAPDAPQSRIDGLDAWPRERLVAAVQLAWQFGAVPRPLPRTRAEITPEDRAVIEAADELLGWGERTGRVPFSRTGDCPVRDNDTAKDNAPREVVTKHVEDGELFDATLTIASHGVSPAIAPAEVPTGNMPQCGDSGSSPDGRLK